MTRTRLVLLAIAIIMVAYYLRKFEQQGSFYRSGIVAAYFDNSSIHRPPLPGQKPFSLADIDPDLVTDLYYAFAYFGFVNTSVDPTNPRLTGTYEIQPTDAADQTVLYPMLQELKNKSKKGLKTHLSIGGWNFNDPQDPQGAGIHTSKLFSKMVSSDASRRQFIDAAIAYAHQYNFDGIDIDWEFPGVHARGGHHKDFDNLLAFFQECYQAFHSTEPQLLLSFTVPPFVPYGAPQQYIDNPSLFYSWVKECSNFVDRINVMAYDYHGPFDDPKITGANAPLEHDTLPFSPLFIAATLGNYIAAEVPKHKILLGIPTFGHSYSGVEALNGTLPGPGSLFEGAAPPGSSTKTPGLLAFYEICYERAMKELETEIDPITTTAYGYNRKDRIWISFDNPKTTASKAQMAFNYGLGGIFFWTIDMDDYSGSPSFPNIRWGKVIIGN